MLLFIVRVAVVGMAITVVRLMRFAVLDITAAVLAIMMRGRAMAHQALEQFFQHTAHSLANGLTIVYG